MSGGVSLSRRNRPQSTWICVFGYGCRRARFTVDVVGQSLLAAALRIPTGLEQIFVGGAHLRDEEDKTALLPCVVTERLAVADRKTP